MNDPTENLTERIAMRFSHAAHGAINQRRKYDGSPYIGHCYRVAAMVASSGAAPDVIAAAYLHDVAEDVPLKHLWELSGRGISEGDCPRVDSRIERLKCLTFKFGIEIATLVEEVTDVSQLHEGNREIRKEKDRMHLARASNEAKTIKLADLIDNAHDIQAGDPEFAKVYMAEKELLLEVLKGGNEDLYMKAMRIVQDFKAGK